MKIFIYFDIKKLIFRVIAVIIDFMNNYKIKNIAGYLSKVFLDNPLTPILAIAILLLGFVALNTMPREEDPQI